MCINYKVRQGDCIASIADRYGFFWGTLWSLPENQEVRQKRQNPNVLLPGDEVIIPDLRERHEPCATEQRHRFVRRGTPSKFRLRLLRDGQPRAGVAYELELDGRLSRGVTDHQGIVQLPVPPGASKGLLRLHEQGWVEERTMLFGHMDPIDVISGVQKRLENLGYGCRATGTLDDDTRAALQEFQRKNDLEVTGEDDEATRAKLAETHGC